MRPQARAGRIQLASALAALCAAALIVVVLFFWLPARMRLAAAEAERGVEFSSSADESVLARAIERLDERLARLEATIAAQNSREGRDERKPVEPADARPVPIVPGAEGFDEFHKDLAQMSKRIDLLAEALKENRKPSFSMPTLEQIHAGRRDIDWAYVDQLRRACLTDPNAATQSVRLMTFDDVLKKVGVPTSIGVDEGGWRYARIQFDESGKEEWRGVTFRFVGDSVSAVYNVN